MRTFRRIARTSVVLLSLILTPSAPGEDPILDLVNRVSLDQYQVYQVDIQNMGLGLYGGPAYNQGSRNRDGWRSGGTLGNQEACLYLSDQFTAMGLTTTIQGNYRNVVGELTGVTNPRNVYIIGGHYDTTSSGEYPGGDDNASGTAGVVEAARILSRYRFDATLRFIGFNAEEDWMWGSQDYVNKVLVPGGDNVLGVINLDMILRPAWDSQPTLPIDLELETANTAKNVAWVNVFRTAATKYVPLLPIDPTAPHTEYWDAGDQGPFISAGYPAIMVIDNGANEIWSGQANAYYHSPNDASDKLANNPKSPSGVTYDYDFAANVVRASVATLAGQAKLVETHVAGFKRFLTLDANDAEHVEEFTILDPQSQVATDYLVIANHRNALTYDVNSVIYRWDGASFVEFQSIPTKGAADAECFSIDGDTFLAVANMYDGTTHNLDSKIYQWDGTRFVEFQSVPTQGASDMEFFAFEGGAYLAVANLYDDVTHNLASKIYQWDGTAFVEFQTIPTNAGGGWEFFESGGEIYLAVANCCTGATYKANSMIYRWNGSLFVGFQTVPTVGAVDWKFFTIDDAAYLAVANSYDGVTRDVASTIYKWNGYFFASYQSIPTHGAGELEFLSLSGQSYLAVANEGGNTTIFRWNGTRFVEFESLNTGGAGSLASFVLDGVPCLAAAGASDGAAVILYRFDGPYTGNLDGDDDVDLGDYATLAAAWRTRQGQSLWDESCDLSVPADNVIDARDLSVLAGRWLKKPPMASLTVSPSTTESVGPYPPR